MENEYDFSFLLACHNCDDVRVESEKKSKSSKCDFCPK